MNIDQIASSVLEQLRSLAKTETVIGEPVQAGDFTIIPVSRVSIGFGTGGNQGKSETAGTGGGAVVEPIAFLVMNGEEVKLMPVHQSSNALHKVVDLVPDLLQMFKK